MRPFIYRSYSLIPAFPEFFIISVTVKVMKPVSATYQAVTA